MHMQLWPIPAAGSSMHMQLWPIYTRSGQQHAHAVVAHIYPQRAAACTCSCGPYPQRAVACTCCHMRPHTQGSSIHACPCTRGHPPYLRTGVGRGDPHPQWHPPGSGGPAISVAMAYEAATPLGVSTYIHSKVTSRLTGAYVTRTLHTDTRGCWVDCGR